MVRDEKAAARTKRAAKKKSASRRSKTKPKRFESVASLVPVTSPQLMTNEEAIAELADLKKRFRKVSAERNGALLHARWETALFDHLKEGSLWIPSPSEANVMLQGFVYLEDHEWLHDGQATVAGKRALYSPAKMGAADTFRSLATEGGGIITRIPQLESALKAIVCGTDAGNNVEGERWWLGYLFGHVASAPQAEETDMGQWNKKTKKWSKGPIHKVEIKQLNRESEHACESLIQLLRSGHKLVRIPSDWKPKLEFRAWRHDYTPPEPKRALDDVIKVELRDIPFFMHKVFDSADSTERVRAAIRAWSRDYQTAMTIRKLMDRKRRLNRDQQAFIKKRDRSSLTAWLLTSADLVASLRDRLVVCAAVYDATTSAEPKFNPWHSVPNSDPECWSLLTDRVRSLSESEVKWLREAFDRLCDELGIGRSGVQLKSSGQGNGQAGSERSREIAIEDLNSGRIKSRENANARRAAVLDAVKTAWQIENQKATEHRTAVPVFDDWLRKWFNNHKGKAIGSDENGQVISVHRDKRTFVKAINGWRPPAQNRAARNAGLQCAPF